MKPTRQPWMKFYPADWRADAMLRLCSIGARGLWAEMMCVMHDAEPYGSLLVNGKRIDKKQLAALAGISEKECIALLLELEGNGVFSRDEDGTIYSRRMRRDHEKAVKDRENGSLGGAPDVRRGSVPKSERKGRTYRKSDAPEKTARIFAKTGGRCFWCDVKLIKNPSNEDEYPDGFHVDHLLPICDGGDNSEENLVPACAVCNHDRSKIGWPENSRRKVDPTRTCRVDPTLTHSLVSDSKAQMPEARDQKEVSEANASGVDAPIDHRKRLFDEGPEKLGRITGRGPNACRAFIGKCLKTAADDAVIVLGLIDEAERNKIIDPCAWIAASLKGKSNGSVGQVSAACNDLIDRVKRGFGGAPPEERVRSGANEVDARLLSYGRG